MIKKGFDSKTTKSISIWWCPYLIASFVVKIGWSSNACASIQSYFVYYSLLHKNRKKEND